MDVQFVTSGLSRQNHKDSCAHHVAVTAVKSPSWEGLHGPREWTVRQQPGPNDRQRSEEPPAPQHTGTKSPEPWPQFWRVWGKPRKMKLSHQPRGRVAQNRN